MWNAVKILQQCSIAIKISEGLLSISAPISFQTSHKWSGNTYLSSTTIKEEIAKTKWNNEKGCFSKLNTYKPDCIIIYLYVIYQPNLYELATVQSHKFWHLKFNRIDMKNSSWIINQTPYFLNINFATLHDFPHDTEACSKSYTW